MRIGRVGEAGHEIPVVIDDGRLLDLRQVTPEIDGGFWTAGPARVRQALDSGLLPELEVAATVRHAAPIAKPGALLCIGMNYAAHAAESGAAPPARPIVFLKTPNTVGGPNDAVAIPRRSRKTDWEVELGVVIGARASYLDGRDDALAAIGGYLVANDLSEREFQLEESGGQWSKGKCCAGFSPLGPWLVTPDEVPDPQSLTLRSWVNGELRQDSTTADMVFDVATLIHDLSQYLVLEPGDVILTGTPEGVALSGRFPYLKAGDIVELEIEGLGRQRQVMIDA